MTQIEDFLPFYPEQEDGQIQNKIYHKKEFFDLKLSPNEVSKDQELLQHQKIISRFVSPHTKYTSLLLFHGLGTGKTCSAIAVAESVKDYLLENSFTEIKRTLVFVKNNILELNFKQQLSKVCTSGKYIPQDVSEDTKSYTLRLNKLISRYYEIVTFEQFLDKIKEKSDEFIKNNYSNRLIIIDEAHGFRETNKQRETLYDIIHRFLHTIENCRVLLLTATPIWDKTNEIASLMNLILPLDQQLVTGKKFDELFFKNKSLITKNVPILKKAFNGRVSYLRSIMSNIKRVEKGVTSPYTKYIKVYPTTLSEFQYKILKDVMKKEEESSEEKLTIIHRASLDASAFVFPDKSYSVEGFNKHCVSNKKYKLDKETTDFIGGSLDNLKQLSSKYHFIINSIQKNPKELVFIYTPFVIGSGAILLGEVLKLFGYVQAKSSVANSKAKRFAIISSDTQTTFQSKQIANIINSFNDPKNIYGDYIQIIIGTEKISHGITLKNVRQTHVLIPDWNIPSIDQALGRVYRFMSHESLPFEERYLNIYRLVSVFGQEKLIDSYVYSIAEEKDYMSSQIYRLLKESSFDCGLTYDRNVLPEDKDGSRECDYQKCKYKCDITETTELDISNFDLYYNKKEIESFINRINEIFKRKNQIEWSTLKILFENVYDEKTMLDGLDHIISNFIPIINKNGYITYLKEESNIFYLSDSVEKTNYSDVIYLDRLFFENENNLERLINQENLNYDYKVVKRWCKDGNMKLISKLHTITKAELLETSFFIKNETSKKIQKYFQESIHKIDDKVLHTIYVDEYTGSSYNVKAKSLDSLVNLRVLDKQWDWVKEDKLKYYHSHLSSVKSTTKEKIDSKYGFYGDISGIDKKFRIVDEGLKGAVCTTSQQDRIIARCLKVGVVVEKDHYKDKTKEEMLQILKDLKAEQYIVNSHSGSLQELKTIANILKLKKKQQCDLLQKRLEQLGLLLK